MINSISSGGYSSMMLSGTRGGTGQPDPTKMQERLFSKADTDGNGSIDKTELAALMESTSGSNGSSSSVSADELFSQMDGDGDGQITQQEATDAASKLLEDLQSQFMQSGMGAMAGMPPPPPPPEGGSGETDEEDMFSSIDTDGDGNISKAELSAFFESAPAGNGQAPSVDDIFSRDDSDGDSLISKDEFMAAMEARKGEHPGRSGSSSQGQTSSEQSSNGSDAMVEALLQLYRSVGQSASSQNNEALLSLFA